MSKDNDEIGDLVFTSASFAADKSHIYFLEHSGVLDVRKDNEMTPDEIAISQNYPNPFNPLTKFVYTINNPGVASLKIYDVTGKLIYTVFDEYKEIGTFEEEWRSIDENNQAVSSGVYFYNLSLATGSVTKKMVLSK